MRVDYGSVAVAVVLTSAAMLTEAACASDSTPVASAAAAGAPSAGAGGSSVGGGGGGAGTLSGGAAGSSLTGGAGGTSLSAGAGGGTQADAGSKGGASGGLPFAPMTCEEFCQNLCAQSTSCPAVDCTGCVAICECSKQYCDGGAGLRTPECCTAGGVVATTAGCRCNPADAGLFVSVMCGSHR
jgi:hypothetical protein